jgi:hypothetical protein
VDLCRRLPRMPHHRQRLRPRPQHPRSRRRPNPRRPPLPPLPIRPPPQPAQRMETQTPPQRPIPMDQPPRPRLHHRAPTLGVIPPPGTSVGSEAQVLRVKG